MDTIAQDLEIWLIYNTSGPTKNISSFKCTIDHQTFPHKFLIGFMYSDYAAAINMGFCMYSLLFLLLSKIFGVPGSPGNPPKCAPGYNSSTA